MIQILRDFIFWVKIVQKGAGEIQAKYNFNNFPSKLLIFRWVNNFKQLDHFSTTLQSLQQQENKKKRLPGVREHCSSEGVCRATSLAMLRCASSATMATWGMFYELL